jgi:3-deoxy-D-manno-octulosonate 8-phosphate phosphatase (KDO 8-P phosphatase)
MKSSSLKSKLKKISILATDVDGVLTDGGMYYSKNGDIMKKFHTRDGMGVSLLKKNSISTILITKEATPMVKQWSKKMNIKKLYDGVLEKDKILPLICKNFSVNPSQIAFIGDDVNDLPLLNKIGFSASPFDAINLIKKNVNYVCKNNGGQGVLREVADMILQSKFPNKKDWY